MRHIHIVIILSSVTHFTKNSDINTNTLGVTLKSLILILTKLTMATKKQSFKELLRNMRVSLMVQGLGLHTPNAGDPRFNSWS